MQHEWVVFIQSPIHIIPGMDGDPIIFVDPDERQAAEEEAVYGCKNCDEPLSLIDWALECVGVSSDIS